MIYSSTQEGTNKAGESIQNVGGDGWMVVCAIIGFIVFIGYGLFKLYNL